MIESDRSGTIVDATEPIGDPRPPIEATHSTVDYSDGSSAIVIYAGAEEFDGTAEWVSAIGDSFVGLDDAR